MARSVVSLMVICRPRSRDVWHAIVPHMSRSRRGRAGGRRHPGRGRVDRASEGTTTSNAWTAARCPARRTSRRRRRRSTTRAHDPDEAGLVELRVDRRARRRRERDCRERRRCGRARRQPGSPGGSSGRRRACADRPCVAARASRPGSGRLQVTRPVFDHGHVEIAHRLPGHPRTSRWRRTGRSSPPARSPARRRDVRARGDDPAESAVRQRERPPGTAPAFAGSASRPERIPRTAARASVRRSSLSCAASPAATPPPRRSGRRQALKPR